MEKKKSPGRTALAVASAALLAAVCILLDSRYDIQLTDYELASDRLPPEMDGLRIVQLSDLHGAEFGRDNGRLIRLVEGQRPDIIALTGDMAGSPGELAALESLLAGIAGLAPVYYVSGNHEFAGGVIDELRALLEKYQVRSLENEYEVFEKNGGRIAIAGVDDPNGRADMVTPAALCASLRSEYPGDYALLLGHRNYWVARCPELPVDLVLCGHAHGGIVRLPFVGGLLNTNHSFGAEYEAGLYYSGSYCMEVSRGLGNSISVPRLFNRPELVTIVLRSGQ